MNASTLNDSIHAETDSDIAYIMSMTHEELKNNPHLRLVKGEVPSISATKAAPMMTIQAKIMNVKKTTRKSSASAGLVKKAKAADATRQAPLFWDAFAPRYKAKLNPWPRITPEEVAQMPLRSARLARMHSEHSELV